MDLNPRGPSLVHKVTHIARMCCECEGSTPKIAWDNKRYHITFLCIFLFLFYAATHEVRNHQVCFHWEAEQNVVGCHQECVKRTNCFVHSDTRKVIFHSFHLAIYGLGCKKLKVYESPKGNHSKTNTLESLHYKYMLILKRSTALVLEVIDRRLGRAEAKDNHRTSPCFIRIMNGPPHHPMV